MKILAATATGLLLLGLAACGELSTSSDSAICDAGPCEILGTFALQSIDGEALPAVVNALTDPIFVEVTEGSVTFTVNGSIIEATATPVVRRWRSS